MLKRIYIRFFNPLLLVACCMALLSSCNDSDKPIDDSLVTLKIVLPSDEIQEIKPDETRAGTETPGTEEESKINTLIFMIYSGSNVFEIEKSVEIKADWTSDDPMWDKTSKSLRIPVTQGSKKIYCIANWSLTGTADMPLINKTTASSPTALVGIVRTHNGITLANPPVMTASISTNIGAATQSMEVKLQRQVARVEIWPKISDELSILGANVTITGVKFMNLPTKSYLFPQSTIASPSGTAQWNQSSYFNITSSALTKNEVELATKYYIPEYKPANASLATVMIIRATYNGRTMYYRIMIDPSVNASPAHNAYVIERNHTYRYKLTILGEGSTSENTRSIGYQPDTNIACELEIR